MRLTLPYPPSVNRYWRSVDGRVLISREGRQYRQAVDIVVAMSGRPSITGPIAARIWLHPPDGRRRDVDNTLKACLDALQHAGVYADDSLIVRLTVSRESQVPGGCAVVRLHQVSRCEGNA